MTTPEHGHQFHFSVRTQGSYTVTGERIHHDSPDISDPFQITVRAWNLRDACMIAAQASYADWSHPNDESRGAVYAAAAVLREAHAHAYYEALLNAFERGGIPGPRPEFDLHITDVEMWLDQAQALADAGLLREP